MEIAQVVTQSFSQTSSLMSEAAGSSSGSYSSFSECMNSFLDAVHEVKQLRKDSAVAMSSGTGLEKSELHKKGMTFADDTVAAEYAGTQGMLLQPLTPEEKEAFERIAVLVADGSLDAEELSELSSDELDELAGWVLAGAGGIFEVYTETSAAEGTEEESGVDFGLGNSALALSQLEEVFGKIEDIDMTASKSALIGELINIDELDPVEIDKLAQAILGVAEQYAAQGGMGEGENSGEEALLLREMLDNVPEGELLAAVEGALTETEIDAELPELPQAVLKSLCIEVVNVNNQMLDAAETNSKLLDGLNNNSELREAILAQLASREAEAELIGSVQEKITDLTSEKVVTQLAEAVLEDSDSGELEELNQELAAMVVTEGEDSNAPAEIAVTEDVLAEEGVITGSEQQPLEVSQNAKVASGGESMQSNQQTAAGVTELEPEIVEKGAVTEERVATSNEVSSAEQLKNNNADLGKDNLTGRAYDGNNEQSTQDNELEDDASAKDGNTKNGQVSSADKLLLNDELKLATVADFSENLIEAETKVESKVVMSETAPAPYTSDNAYVKYADMLENMDKLSRLMQSSAEKSMKSVTMELSPPELGKLTLEVSVKDGHANAAIKVETDGAKQMLLNNVEQLKRNMEAHGIKLENFEVELNKEEQQGRQQQSLAEQMQQNSQHKGSRQKQSGSASNLAGKAITDVVEAESGTKNIIGDDGSVDIVA